MDLTLKSGKPTNYISLDRKNLNLEFDTSNIIINFIQILFR